MKRILLAVLVALTAAMTAAPAAQATPRPIVVIYMENHNLAWITSHPSLVPYQYALWKGTASTPAEAFTAYTDAGPGSLPDYLAFATGTYITTTGFSAGSFKVRSVWDQLTAAGVPWGVYGEGMPGVCSSVKTHNDSATDGQYIMGHNPAVPLAPVYHSAECQHVQPLSSLGALPAVSFITPNMCNDMHGLASGNPFMNCVTGSAGLAKRSDAWLAREVPALVATGADVFITYDEGSGDLFAVETGQAVTNGARFATTTGHYGLLAGVEQAWGLPRLGKAASAAPVPFP